MRAYFGCGWLTLFVGFLPALAAEPDTIPPPLGPIEALTTFHLTPGFEIELVAAEPLIADPIALAWGADGRLWVVEMGDYPLGVDGRGAHGGNVKILTDMDGDGHYDRATTFLAGLGFPTGVLPWGKGAIVSTAPEIFYAEDRDGDGRAEHRETLIRGLAEGNQQHRVNGLRLGLDNWVHCANGDSGGTIEAVKSGVKLTLGRRDFRFRVDDGRLEPVTGTTQFGLDMDDWGHWFGSSNSRPLTHYVLPEHYLRRNPHVVVPTTSREVPEASGAAAVFPVSRTLARFNDLNKVNRFTSACGGTIYRDELLGHAFMGNSFVCEPVHNLVHREVLEPQGTSFVSRRAPEEQRSEFVASTDVWFRPVMARTGPDGALWIVDMYRAVVEHPEWIPKDWQAKLDLRAGHERGRIYRVYPAESEPRPIRNLSQLKPDELVLSLENPSGTVRDLARQALLERKNRDIIPQLRDLAANGGSAPARVQAVSLLVELGDHHDLTIRQLLRDSAPEVQVAGVRLWEHVWKRAELVDNMWAADFNDIRQLMLHDHAPLRMQLALSLGELNEERIRKLCIRDLSINKVGELLAQLALRNGHDSLMISAIMSSINQDNLRPFTDAIFEPSVTPGMRHGLLEPWIHSVLGLSKGHEPEILFGHFYFGTNGAFNPILIVKPTSDALEQLRAIPILADGVERRLSSYSNVGQRPPDHLVTLAESIKSYGRSASEILGIPDIENAVQVAMIPMLGRDATTQRQDVELLIGLLSPKTSHDVRETAAAALERIGHSDTADLIIQQWQVIAPAVRPRILDAFLGRVRWIETLLTGIEQNKLDWRDLSAAQRQRLTQHRTPRIRERATKLLATVQNTPRAQLVEQYHDVLQLAGDRSRGSQVFAKRCAACHKLGEVGHPIGPDLTALTDKSPLSLLTALLDPNRAVETKYLTYTAITTAGVTHTGMLVDESGGSITLLAGENKRVTLVRSEIDELAGSTKSLMPEGLEKDVSRQDIADLLAMLGELRPPRKQFAGNAPIVVQPESLRGEFWLLASQAEIYGSTLVYEPTFQNLGYWQSADDHAAWTFEVPLSGKFELSCEYAVPVDSAGNVGQVLLGNERWNIAFKSTGGWEKFDTATLGQVTLAAGQHRLIVRADGKPRGALCDLKSVRLRPIK